jgi:hypothetical protein
MRLELLEHAVEPQNRFPFFSLIFFPPSSITYFSVKDLWSTSFCLPLYTLCKLYGIFTLHDKFQAITDPVFQYSSHILAVTTFSLPPTQEMFLAKSYPELAEFYAHTPN